MSQPTQFGTRLRAARLAAGFKTAKAFIKKYHIPAATYSQHESGERQPSQSRIDWYSKLLGVDVPWLSNGEGVPYTLKRGTQHKRSVISEQTYSIKHNDHILNEALLQSILYEIEKLKKKHQRTLTPKKYAELSSSIYTNIVRSENSPEAQRKLVKSATLAIEKLLQK